MLGAVVGDIVGSRFEFKNYKSKEFELFHADCFVTDDSIMTLAVAEAIMSCQGDYTKLYDATIASMRLIGPKYPCSGYGESFFRWLYSDRPKPYDSYGNGAAMRISPIAYLATSLAEVKKYSRAVTETTHNNVEGLKGSEAVACAIFLAREGKTQAEIKDFINSNYYDLNFTLADIRETYEFDVSCQESVPQAIVAFLEANSFEDAIRNAISIGGDADTIAAMTGSIAEAYFSIPEAISNKALTYLDEYQLDILQRFEIFRKGLK
ncbi:MAG TPA: ADP-ribosylglycohydrolase family protein [Bacilli bacterium]|nr:ADP-ribosylglycohydrolase family protein [Bacilli bacterium]